MIELSNLDVVFGRGTPLEKQVLHKINLTMNKGSFVTVIGSNGAGKSTMLGVLAGDVIPTVARWSSLART
ncbi:ABC transporter [Brucella ceti TE28753-12]|nr:ABC transporter [Brucella ceti TE28753-12]